METAAAATATTTTALRSALKRSRKLNSAATTTTNSNRKNSHSDMLLLTPPPGEEEEDGEDGDAEDQVMVTDRQQAEDALVVRRSSLASFSSSSWHQSCYNGSGMTSTSSRIFRVSRASGGKDRHSKVLTAKGLRDRRVRLSVATAIQFYDLQDRLGLDQPSKAVDWLIKAAADAISELPSLEGAFPNSLLLTPSSATTVNYKDDVPPVEDPEPETAAAGKPPSAASAVQLAACSSTSETSKGYILSLSCSKIRVKARERARERAAKDKDKSMADGSITAAATADDTATVHHECSSSFTELLMDGSFRRKMHKVAEPKKEETHSPWTMHPVTVLPDFFASADFFPPIIAHGQSAYAPPPASKTSSLSGISQASLFTSNCNPVMVDNHHHVELHPFSFFQDHVSDSNSYGLINISVPGSCGSFSASVAVDANNNRGTLQSNSSSATLLQSQHHFQKVLSSSVSSMPTNETSVLPFFIGSMPSSTNSAENQFPVAELDARLQLSYGTAAGVQQEQQERCGRNYLSDANKGKGKN